MIWGQGDELEQWPGCALRGFNRRDLDCGKWLTLYSVTVEINDWNGG